MAMLVCVMQFRNRNPAVHRSDWRMDREDQLRVTRLLKWLGVAAAVVLGVWGLGQFEPRPDWLKVQGPPQAIVGRAVILRVQIRPLEQPAYVCADLHWSRNRDSSEGYLAGGGAKLAGKEGGLFEFKI